MASNVRLLDEEQTGAFDIEYVDDVLFTRVAREVGCEAPEYLLDVGGGNGLFLDRLLARFPTARGVLVEPDQHLLARNRVNPRKQLIQGTFQHADVPHEGRYDALFFNWVLHHFVTGSYRESLALQRDGLDKAVRLLKPGGRVLIFENFYDGFVVDDLPGGLIHALTSSKALRGLVKLLGANTAGVGVCFHSGRKWESLVQDSGLDLIESRHYYDYGELSSARKMALHLRRVHVGLLIAETRC